MAQLDAILKRADDNLPSSLDKLFALLRIPSISTDPAYKEKCTEAADWLVAELNALDVSAVTPVLAPLADASKLPPDCAVHATVETVSALAPLAPRSVHAQL